MFNTIRVCKLPTERHSAERGTSVPPHAVPRGTDGQPAARESTKMAERRANRDRLREKQLKSGAKLVAPPPPSAPLDVGVEDDGWAVLVPGSQGTPRASARPTQSPAKQAVKPKAAAAPGVAAGAPPGFGPSSSSSSSSSKAPRGGGVRTPFVDVKSKAGLESMLMLQKRLAATGQLGRQDLDDLAAQVRAGQAGTGGPTGAAAYAARQLAKQRSASRRRAVVYEDEYGNELSEAEDDEDDAEPAFELNIQDGGIEIVDYDSQGRRIVAAPLGSDRGSRGAQEDDEAKFGEAELADAEEIRRTFDQFGWEQFDADDDDDDAAGGSYGRDAGKGGAAASPAVVAALPSPSSSRRVRREQQQRYLRVGGVVAEDDDDEADAAAPGAAEGKLGGKRASTGTGAADVDEDAEEDWGLRGLSGRGSAISRQLEGIEKQREERRGIAGTEADVEWGGSGMGYSAVDLEEQEEMLKKIFRSPAKVAQLLQHQKEVVEHYDGMRRKAAGRTEGKLHSQLRVVAGKAAGVRLLSSAGPQTRPMMEKVRQALFNMILSQAGNGSVLPPGSRWLDIFSGTGSVGLEALSRGAEVCHFVEMDPRVNRTILGRNIASCGFTRASVVHTSRAEDFLARAGATPNFAGGPFDFVSMCPPYLLVSYPQLFELLAASRLMHDGTILFVEYPKQLAHEIPEAVGPLVKVRDRKYGRTLIAVYGPPEYDDDYAAAAVNDDWVRE